MTFAHTDRQPSSAGASQTSSNGSWDHDVSKDYERRVHRRQEAVDRVRAMHNRHLDAAWEQRHRDPIGPFALAFLYQQPAADGRFTELKAATRLWLAGERPGGDWTPGADLADLLGTVNTAITARREYDVRSEFADNTDEGMRLDARFIGLGVSSLDNTTTRWEQAQRTANGVTDVHGTAFITMTDGTLMVIERGVRFGLRETVIQSSEALTAPGGHGLMYPYVHVAAPLLLGQGPDAESRARYGPYAHVLYAMWGLTRTVWQLDAARTRAAEWPGV